MSGRWVLLALATMAPALAHTGGATQAQELRRAQGTSGGFRLRRPRWGWGMKKSAEKDVTDKAEKKGGGFSLFKKVSSVFKAEPTQAPQGLNPHALNLSLGGLPNYFWEVMPPKDYYMNMSFFAKQDFYWKVNRWHGQMELAGGCSKVEPGEKLVYFALHGDHIPKAKDPGLWDLGKAQAQNFIVDPMLTKAVWGNASTERAQLIVMSPARKTIETAILGFGYFLSPDINVTWEIDPLIMGAGIEGVYKKDEVLNMLMTNFTNTTVGKLLLRQYQDLPSGWEHGEGSHRGRFDEFVQKLLRRKEERIIVIMSKMLMKLAGMQLHPAEVRMKALAPNGTFRDLSPHQLCATSISNSPLRM